MSAAASSAPTALEQFVVELAESLGYLPVPAPAPPGSRLSLVGTRELAHTQLAIWRAYCAKARRPALFAGGRQPQRSPFSCPLIWHVGAALGEEQGRVRWGELAAFLLEATGVSPDHRQGRLGFAVAGYWTGHAYVGGAHLPATPAAPLLLVEGVREPNLIEVLRHLGDYLADCL